MNYTRIILKYGTEAVERHHDAQFLHQEIMKELGTEGAKVTRKKVARFVKEFFAGVKANYFVECPQCKWCKIVYQRVFELDLTQLERECRETLFMAAQALLRRGCS